MDEEPNICRNSSGRLILSRPSEDKSSPIERDEDLTRFPACLQGVLSNFSVVVGSVGTCVILEGPTGCGKTKLVQSLASLKNHKQDLMVVYLGEQIDAKVLLGTFTSTNTPGEFVWKPGPLTKAVESGMWLLMEDIELATPDVLALLLPLVKNGELMIPGYTQPIRVAQEFKMFLSQRTYADGKTVFSPSFPLLQLLRQHSTTFSLPPLNQDCISQILLGNHPGVDTFVETLVSVTNSLNVHIRQLLKLCERVSPQIYDGRITSVEDFMLEVIDCVCGRLSLTEREQVAVRLGCLVGGISKEKVEQLCRNHRPSVHISMTALSVGRAHIGRLSPGSPHVCFAHTSAALRLLESVCRCVQVNEPVLLVGETGVGKTAVVNYLSKVTGNKLVVFNMSEQTESTDLLGGFKPLQVSHLLTPVKEEFERLFHATFSLKQNAHFLSSVQESFTKQKWKKLLKLMRHSVEAAISKLEGLKESTFLSVTDEWHTLAATLAKFQKQIAKSQTAFAFDFVEGALVEAVRSGSWILLDEVNLASSETLQCLSGLLESSEGSFLLPEKLDAGPVSRHSNFRLFCCMNPATDIGKKLLPHSIRSRLTEFYVDEVQTTSDLRLLVRTYLQDVSPPTKLVEGIIKLHQEMQELAENRLQDGTGRKPHYSLRNLCRALTYCQSMSCGTLLRSAYEGFCMSLLSEVRSDFHPLIISLITRHLSVPKSCISAPIPRPTQQGCVLVEGFWLHQGSCSPSVPESYILTPTVKMNIKNLARVISARSHPILLQGPTSAGKTSMVQYLAKVLGNKCLRINNHEHTDLQEYVGMYTADSKGQLVFQEGVLVDALRNGYWIILDELNLAPTEVLEALNRVLDDNRELFIPETQELVKAHPNFLLFGTQNPPGVYAGRKVLSRAFRNRFIELHFDDILPDELIYILQQRCSLPQSYAKRMVEVMKELQIHRSESGIFHGKYGLITLRDLFRWAERYRKSEVSDTFYDWEQQIAEDGYMLLGGRLRNTEERNTILEVVQKHFKRVVDPLKLFGLDGGAGSLASQYTISLIQSTLPPVFQHLVWTDELQTMAVLVHRAIHFNEPVLLVGATGCGKTSLCQLLSAVLGRQLFSVNCHLHTDAADFLGGLRPVRNRHSKEESSKSALFEWSDGVVIQAMNAGGCLLIDEISLAGDAVLERLNSILETERKLLVSERTRLEGEVYEITASEGFAVFATMNPGGDYGKKELSPALRNRFVEIWCPVASSRKSYKKIIEHNLEACFLNTDVPWSDLICDVVEQLRDFSSVAVSVRDLLTWVTFMNTTSNYLSPAEGFYHGAHLVFVDALGCGGSVGAVDFKQDALRYLKMLLKQSDLSEPGPLRAVCDPEKGYGIPPFFINTGPKPPCSLSDYSLSAPGPSENLFRLLRAMQLGKPLLLEGPPGVGKTSLVMSLAQASQNRIVRINLSEQTDVSDLFGADLPVDSGEGVQFAWRNGPFLKALQNGDWIVLDEMNLASQSVLEGLNACLDHRGEIYIPELGMYFKVKKSSRLFACQNPLRQGGGRKGLPKSFINRFTQVFMDKLSQDDLLHITSHLYPKLSCDMLKRMISFTYQVDALVKSESSNNLWEFNLRDVLRWCSMMCKHKTVPDPSQHVRILYCSRLRQPDLHKKVCQLFVDVFEVEQLSDYKYPAALGQYFHVSKDAVQVGCAVLPKAGYHTLNKTTSESVIHLKCQMKVLEVLAHCVEMGWVTIIAGKSCTGKSSVVRSLAEMTGHKLLELPMSSVTDTTDLLGGFEQVNLRRHCVNLASLVHDTAVCMLSAIRGSIDQLSTKNLLTSIATELSEEFSPAVCRGDRDKTSLLGQCNRLKHLIHNIQQLADTVGVPLMYDMEDVLLKLNALSKRVDGSETSGQFEWVDSVLVKAVKYGHWLMISHANFCSPSVLDRLNALLEPGGVLTLDEKGIVDESEPIIQPHPDFRLFLTIDPGHGEISRAMRNRGIEVYISTEDSVLNNEIHQQDLRSMLLSKTSLDHNSCSEILHLLQGDTKVLPRQLVNLVKCYQTLLTKDGSDSISALTDAKNILGWHTESESLATDLPVPVSYSATSAQLYTHPAVCVASQDIVPVLHAANTIQLDLPLEGADRAMLLNAALEVFVCSSTTQDLHIRLKMLKQLSELLSNNPCYHLVISAWTHVLTSIKVSPLPSLSGYNLDQVYPTSNPLLSLIADDQLNLCIDKLPLSAELSVLKTTIKRHLDSNDAKSMLQLSLLVYNGSIPITYLPHQALTYLEPFLSHLFKTLTELWLISDLPITNGLSLMMQNFIDWLTVLTSVCMASECSLPAVVSAWNLFKTKGLEPLLPQLQLHSEWETMHSLMTNIHPLEEAVFGAKVYNILRNHLYCPVIPSVIDKISQSNLLQRDNLIRLSNAPSMPFFLLPPSLVEARMSNLSSWADLAVPHENEPCLTTQECGSTFVALRPLLFYVKTLLTQLLVDPSACSSKCGCLVKKSVNYSLQISSLCLSSLQPLLQLEQTFTNSSSIEQVIGLTSGLVEAVFSGFSLAGKLSESVLTERSFLTEMCFSLLTTHSKDDHSQVSKPAVSIDSLQSKRQEISTLLQFVWLHENSCVFCPLTNLEVNTELLDQLFTSLLKALKKSVLDLSTNESIVQSATQKLDLSDLDSNVITSLCLEASKCFGSHIDSQMWHVVHTCCVEVSDLLHSLKSELHILDYDDIVVKELSLLDTLHQAMARLGVVFVSLLSPSKVDPVALATAENHCQQAVSKNCFLLLKCWYQHYTNMVGQDFRPPSSFTKLSGVAPLLTALYSRHHNWDNQCNKCQVPPRVNCKKYYELQRVATDIRTTLCSPANVLEMLRQLQEAEFKKSVFNKLTSWEKATLGAVTKLEGDFSEFPDVVQPLSMALTLIVQGVGSLTATRKYKDDSMMLPMEHVLNVARYPVDSRYNSQLDWLQNIISLLLTHGQESSKMDVIAKQRLFKVVLATSMAHLHQSRRRHFHLQRSFSSLLKYFWNLWKKAQIIAKEESLEAESLYRWKTKEHQIEQLDSTDTDRQMSSLFPSFDDIFSTEDQQSEKMELDSTEVGSSCKQGLLFQESDLHFACSIHMLLHNQDPLLQSAGILDSAQELYNLASCCALQADSLPGLSNDFLLQGAHMRMCVSVGNSLKQTHSRSFNVYKEGNVLEAERSLVVVKDLVARILLLLDEWPEHPILNQVLGACNKVLSLGIQEPLMKVLTGLEGILSKAQDWESYASSAVSFKSEIEALMEIILDWRKLEFNFYENLLGSHSSEVKAGTSRWWFHLYGLCHELTDNVDGFTTAVQSFMESSPIGEYESRLQLIKTFHSELSSKDHRDGADILANVLDYYSQFSLYVSATMEKMTSSVTKDFKDQLSVMRWSDGSYWSLKSSVQTSHKKFLNLLNKYEGILSQPVLPVLTELSVPSEGPSDCSGQDQSSLIAVIRLIVQTEIPHTSLDSPIDSAVDIPVLFENEELAINSQGAFHKMSEILEKFFASNSCLQCSEQLTELTGVIIETVEELSSTSFLDDVVAEKRDSAIRLRQSQKRKMLSDLFKQLQSHGLSFKSGLDTFTDHSMAVIFQLPRESLPVEMLSVEPLWKKMNLYYERCVARLSTVQSAFSSPSKELTFGQLSRCKGYAYALMSAIVEQRDALMSAVREFRSFQTVAEKLESSVSGRSETNNTDYSHWIKELCDTLEQCLYLINSTDYLANTAPDNQDLSLTPMTLQNLNIEFEPEERNKVLSVLMAHQHHVQEAYNRAVRQECFTTTCKELPLVSRQDMKILTEGFDCVKDFTDAMTTMSVKRKKFQRRSSIFFFWETYRRRLQNKYTQFSLWVTSNCVGEEKPVDEECCSNPVVLSLTKFVLLAFQKCSPSLTLQDEAEKMQFVSLRAIRSKSLTDLNNTNITQIKTEMVSLLTGFNAEEVKVTTNQLKMLCQLTHRYIRLCYACFVQSMTVQATLCKLSSILFNLFASLGTKGFCKPSDESKSSDADGTDFVDVDAGGFAEGSGDKNVSSQAEPENLEPGRSEEDQQPKQKPEEDNDAISITEDMDEEPYDVNNEEGQANNTDEQSEDEEFDNAMGELESKPDIPEDLNKNMWAPDSDQREEEVADSNEGGGTEATNEDNVVAKDDVCEDASTEKVPQYEAEEMTDDIEPDVDDDDAPIQSAVDDIESVNDLDSNVSEEELQGPSVEETVSDGEEITDPGVHGEEDPQSGDLPEPSCTSSLSTSIGGINDGQQTPTPSEVKEDNLQDTSMRSDAFRGESNPTSSMISSQINQQSRRRRFPNDQERVAASASESPMKKAKLANHEDSTSDIPVSENASLYRHIAEVESSEYDNTAWDLSATNGQRPDFSDSEDKLEEEMEETYSEEDVNGDNSQDHIMGHILPQDPIENGSQKQIDDKESSTENFGELLPKPGLNYFSKIGKDHKTTQLSMDSMMRDELLSSIVTLQMDSSGTHQSAVRVWRQYVSLTSNLCQSLYEELCLILIPTTASQLKGDYRSGKQLNMRRVIPFIASNYQNDRIWLRRTKLVDRRYQIMVAVDDSSSMQENHCKQMAYESLAVITSAVTRITNGQIGVCRFGENVEVIHPMDRPFTDDDGGHILQHLTFSQTSTYFKEVLKTVQSIFFDNALYGRHSQMHQMTSQLLIILSDGRGIFSDGGMAIDVALRRLNETGVFTVFVILDTQAKESIADIKVPVFTAEKGPLIASYLEVFPFPFYVIIRDLQKMPTVLAEALRQWFECLKITSF